MDEIVTAWIAWAFKNVGIMVCWTILAIHFDKWWIALFALMFLSSLKTENHSDRKADKDADCGV